MGDGTSIGKVRGQGSGNHGSHHWLLQRYTAVGNVLLLFWFVASLLMLPDLGYAAVKEWIARPLPSTAMALLVVTTLWHARLGMQVAMEDYIATSATRFAVTALLNFAAFGGAAFGLLCVIRLALGGAA